MVNVNVNFNGRDYLLACEEGQEEDLQKLTEELSKKFNAPEDTIISDVKEMLQNLSDKGFIEENG